MMKIIIEQNSQIKQMEVKIERFIDEAKKLVVPLQSLPITNMPSAKPTTSTQGDFIKLAQAV